MSKYYLGIDTSNYKTSVAIIDDDNNLAYEYSELLDVKLGDRGLRQSDAFFKHSNRLPVIFEAAFNNIDANKIKSIGVSTRPRRVEGSYMPCFLAGENAARAIGVFSDIPIYKFSHQEGHAAAILSEDEPVILFHLSGGTTEFLLCTKDEFGYDMKIVGGTKDISIGQLIDRIGVALNYRFPAGNKLDEIAFKYSSYNLFPDIKSNNYSFNLSGIETKILRMIDENDCDVESVISTLFYKIAKLLYSSSEQLAKKYKINKVYFAGGVSASKTIRKHILSFKIDDSNKNIDNHNFEIIFGEPKLCGDNAIGIAKLARRLNDNNETSKR